MNERFEKSENEPWKKSDTDKMLDAYFMGSFLLISGHIASRINRFLFDQKRIESYQPLRRVSRKGKRFTKMELNLIQVHRENKIPLEATARILQRDIKEIASANEAKKEKTELVLRMLGIGVDYVLAQRYLYHVAKKPIIPDHEYDALKAEEIEYGTNNELLLSKGFIELNGKKTPLHKTVQGYSLRVRSLANYLLFRHEDGENKK